MSTCPPYGAGNCGPTVTTTTTSIGTPVHVTPHSSELPFTGGDVLGLLLIAVALIIVGLIPKLCRFASARGWQ